MNRQLAASRRGAIALGVLLSSSIALGSAGTEPSLPYLLRLPGDLAEVRYSPGALDRAAHVQHRLELLAGLLSGLSRQPYKVTGWVVEPDDWKRAGFTQPFGLPERAGAWGVAVPAWGTDGSVAVWKALLGGELPAVGGNPVRGTPEEAASLGLSDVLAHVEVTRLFFASHPLSSDAPWVDEVAVHATARLAFSRFEGGRVAEIDALFARLAAAGGGDGARPLSAWRPDLPLRERLWFEAQFARGAALLLEAEREGQVRRLLAKGVKGSRPLTAAELERRAPALVEWRARAFAP